MQVTTTTRSGAVVFALSGRLDGLSSPQLEEIIEAQLADGATRLVFDCSSLSYASSAGLRVFLSTAKKVSSAGGKVAFSSLQPGVAEIFKLSGFDHLFTTHPDLDDALASLA